MTRLSPAAQAVRESAREAWFRQEYPVLIVAAALRAAANVMREAYESEGYVDSPDDWLFDIATELEGSND